jgi:hypothetical protein
VVDIRVVDIRVVDIRVAGILAEDIAGRVVKAGRVADMADRGGMRVRVGRVAVRADHAVGSGNISGRRKSASFASRRWT